MSLVLGVDGGGTKTVCVLMDDTGRVLGRGEAGASNYQSVGEQAAFCSIQSAIGLTTMAALCDRSLASVGTVQVEAICLGLAGVGRSTDIQVIQALVQRLHSSDSLPITWALQPSNVVICNDALIALVGGLGHAVGIVAIAGTGSIVFGRNSQGCTKRVGGWGHILGDAGSAYYIAVSGLQAAMKAYDGCDLPTTLQERIKAHLNLSSLEDLVEVIYRQGWSVKEVAGLAPIVAQEAASGDEVSLRIVEQAANEMVQATQTAINALFVPSDIVEVVTTGRVWQGCPLIRDKFVASLTEKKHLASVIFPRHEPVYGAGLLALNTLSNSGEILI
ncbi:MAG TPA: BadF/BadG/BcrA/BcrD ATPase family protein [Coleofasciculaceae cyanobacterium]